MLKNFNNLFKSILTEQVDVDLNNDEDKSMLMNFYNTNEFFINFLEPLSNDNDVVITKQRNNCFLVRGLIENVSKFFNNLKVNKDFCKDPKEFKIFSPIFTFGERYANLKIDQYYSIDNMLKNDNIPFTHELENFTGKVIEGTWHSFIEDEKNVQKFVKGIKPSDLSKKVKAILSNNKDLKNTEIFIEFHVNTENLKNLLWDEMTEYADDPEEMNVKHNKETK